MEAEMSGMNAWKFVSICLFVIMLGIVTGAFSSGILGRLWENNRTSVAQAAEAAAGEVVPEGNIDATYICTPSYIGTFTNRVHVLCTAPAPGGIYYFAYPTSDSKTANRMLSIMLTAKTLGKTLQIYYDPSGSGSSYGCQVNDCRPITALEITN
jgi:hypothetical protein